MGNAVSQLTKLIPPPRREPTLIDWAEVESRIGLPLPADYKSIVEVYGLGRFDHFLWVLIPGKEYQGSDLFYQIDYRVDALQQLKECGVEIPFSVESGSQELLPWATTDNGDTCYWVTSRGSGPDDWIVTANEARQDGWATYEFSASEFLLAVLSGELRVPVFPDEFPSTYPSFEIFEPRLEDEL
jgi:hypothetical protein